VKNSLHEQEQEQFKQGLRNSLKEGDSQPQAHGNQEKQNQLDQEKIREQRLKFIMRRGKQRESQHPARREMRFRKQKINYHFPSQRFANNVDTETAQSSKARSTEAHSAEAQSTEFALTANINGATITKTVDDDVEQDLVDHAVQCSLNKQEHQELTQAVKNSLHEQEQEQFKQALQNSLKEGDSQPQAHGSPTSHQMDLQLQPPPPYETYKHQSYEVDDDASVKDSQGDGNVGPIMTKTTDTDDPKIPCKGDTSMIRRRKKIFLSTES